MKRIMFWCACFVVFTPSFLFAADYWLARYSGPAFMGEDIPNDMTVDAQGNVYVIGLSYNGSAYDYATVKYDADGNQLWVARYPRGEANALAVDKAGDVYVTGLSGGDYVTIKYDRNGNEVWIAKYNHGTDYYSADLAYDIALDGNGNVYVTGISWESGYYYATIKYDKDGSQLWIRREYSDWDAYPPSLSLDNEGNAYVAGHSSQYYLLVKYDTDGNKVWEKRNDSGNNFYMATGVTVDSVGNVSITGLGWTSSTEYVTMKYDKDGNQIWANRIGNAQIAWYFPYNPPNPIVVDGLGNVYITGNVYNDDGTISVSTTKYGTNGNQLYSVRYGNRGVYEGIPPTIAVDAQGNAYMASVTYDSNHVADYLVIKYDTNGNEQWVAKYNGASTPCLNHDDRTKAIAVDDIGNVYVTGTSISLSTWYDYVTVKNPQYKHQDVCNRPPNCSNAVSSLSQLWPPNNEMKDINVLNVIDPDNDPVSVTIAGITQDEPVNEQGSGNTSPDGSGIGADTAWVRAERTGIGNGRVYNISFTASDGKGGQCFGSVHVCVPHDQGDTTCIDDGQIYDSTLLE